MNSHPTRRDILKTTALGAAGVALSPFFTMCMDATTASTRQKKILFFTDSEDFPHEMVSRKSPDQLAFGEQTFKDVGEKAGYDIIVSKDGTLFAPDKIGQFDAFVFYTTGDLTKPPGTKYKSDQTPAMPPEGKDALLKAIAGGKGFMGLHCASDTFHSPGYENKPKATYLRAEQPGPEVDPYIVMLGGEFNSHGSQQTATIRIADPNFPGLAGLKEFTMNEEWYSLYHLAPDLHVILVQDTTTMKKNADGAATDWQYRRDPYPETWARRHGQGRVFYSSMGHRQDVWTNPIYQKVFTAGLVWIAGDVDAKIPPNLATACPQLAQEMKKA